MVQSSATVRVAHIGLDVTDQALEDLFSDYGPIKRCFVVRPKKPKNNNKTPNKTIAYVEFAISEDAETAINEISLKAPELGIPGMPIAVSTAPDRRSDEAIKTEKEYADKRTEVASESKDVSDNREAAKQKKARLIVRNIPWKSTQSTLKSYFETETGGKVVDVNILKKKDGKMVGCAFVQLSNVAEAAKAIKQLNGKPFLNRPIAVDWAVSKEQFNKGNTNVTSTNKVQSNNEQKTEDNVETTNKNDTCEDEQIKSEEDSVDEESEEEGDTSEENSEIKNESDDSTEPVEKPDNKTKNNWPKPGHDIGENKTVFVRNISFDSEQDDLRNMMEDNFGKVLFARLVVDKITEHPKVRNSLFNSVSLEKSII